MLLAASQVAAAVVEILLDETTAGPAVFLGRHWPVPESALPALRVIEGEEDITADDIGRPRPQQHTLQLGVECLVSSLDGIDAAMDALVGEVLLQLFADEDALDSLPNCELELQGISREPASDGPALTARALVRMVARFQTISNDPYTLV